MKLMRYVSIYGGTQKLLAAIFDFVICLPTGGAASPGAQNSFSINIKRNAMCWLLVARLGTKPTRKKYDTIEFLRSHRTILFYFIAQFIYKITFGVFDGAVKERKIENDIRASRCATETNGKWIRSNFKWKRA